jgi:hypothetical protein
MNMKKVFKLILIWSWFSFLDCEADSNEKFIIYLGNYVPFTSCLKGDTNHDNFDGGSMRFLR